MSKNMQKIKVNWKIVLWTLFGLFCAAVFAYCIYCIVVVIPAKKEAERLALEEFRRQQEIHLTITPAMEPVETPDPTELPEASEKTEELNNVPTIEPGVTANEAE